MLLLVRAIRCGCVLNRKRNTKPGQRVELAAAARVDFDVQHIARFYRQRLRQAEDEFVGGLIPTLRNRRTTYQLHTGRIENSSTPTHHTLTITDSQG